MNERPILFSGPMVRAILDGRKSMTRRVVRPQPIMRDGEPIWPDRKRPRGRGFEDCPYGVPGDRLWVREAFMHEPADYCWQASVSIPCRPAHTVYRADVYGDSSGAGWSPSIHMPRNLSRITLEVTGVRVERVQEITPDDCLAEGCDGGHGAIHGYNYNATPPEHFRHICEAINGKDSYLANPWVWVISFRRLDDGRGA